MSAMTAHRAQLARELRDEEAARRWSEGNVDFRRVEDVILTDPHAKDLASHWDGYPTWEQLVELAQLCGVEPLCFTLD